MTQHSPKTKQRSGKQPARRGGLHRFVRRKRRRLYRRHPKARRVVPAATAALCLLAAVGLVSLLVSAALPRHRQAAPTVEVAAPPMTMERASTANVADPGEGEAPGAALPVRATATPRPTATPEPEPTAIPGDDPVYHQAAAPVTDYANPASNKLLTRTKVYSDKKSDAIFLTDEDVIRMGPSDQYASVEGVTTFRGTNYRDGGAYGAIPENPSDLSIVWTKRIHGLDEWKGVGWTGQASVVRWPEELRQQMNIVRAKKQKAGLVEVLYATLDGHIYFLDLDDGQETRSSIDIGAPIKGSLAVDPRGAPLLYCGQGIYDVGGKRVPCGTRVWSLIDQKLLYFLDGKDKKALRPWAAFDCSPLVDGNTDTMITAGENGVLYKVKLNTRQYDGGVDIDPAVTRYVYKQRKDGKLGTENSIAVYNHYVYFATNIGIIQCVDLDTMELVWSFDAKDDIDASLVIEPEGDGVVALYATNELDKRGHDGACQMFKLNALTGELLWKRDSDPIHQNDDNGGGGFGTPAVGKGELSDLVYFHICRTKESRGMLYALDKQTGETVWVKSMGSYGWSSPTCLYAPSGKGYVLIGSSNSVLRLLDGLTGAEVTSIKLKGNIEGTPAVFDDMIVIGTRSSKIYGIRIS